MPNVQLLKDAHALLERNTQSAEWEGETFRFTVPSVKSYPFQWLWDSCFHAIVWAQIDVERAKDELRGLFAFQQLNGMIPHVIFWNKRAVKRTKIWHYLESDVSYADILRGRAPQTTAQTQPPVLAQAVEAIVDADTPEGGKAFAREALPALSALYGFWASERDPDSDGLVSTISQFETGLDFSPSYDALTGVNAHRPYSVFLATRRVQSRHLRARYDNARLMSGTDHVEDMLVISIYIDGLRSLARLARLCGDEALACWAERTAKRSTSELLEQCWDEERGIFWSQAGPEKRRMNQVMTIQGLMPLLLSDLPDSVSSRLIETLTDPKLFWSKYPVPSVALNEPTYLPDSHLHGFRFIWRGPASMNTNYFLWQGLRRHGQSGLASQIAARSRDAVLRGGFNEFYNAETGAPVGAANFGWGTLAAVMS